MPSTFKDLGLRTKTKLVRHWIREPLWNHLTSREELACASDSLKFEELTIGDRIGSVSSNGIVFLAEHKSIKYAVKLFNPDADSVHEAAITTTLGEKARHDNDLPFLMTFGSGKVPEESLAGLQHKSGKFALSTDTQYIVLELAVTDLSALYREERKQQSAGTLESWSKEKMPLLFPTGVSTRIAWQKEVAFHAFCCLRKLHDIGYSHRDAHQSNFMVIGSGKVVIIDFGNAAPVEDKGVNLDFQTFGGEFENWGLPSNLKQDVQPY